MNIAYLLTIYIVYAKFSIIKNQKGFTFGSFRDNITTVYLSMIHYIIGLVNRLNITILRSEVKTVLNRIHQEWFTNIRGDIYQEFS